jgi:hypothetical protein
MLELSFIDQKNYRDVRPCFCADATVIASRRLECAEQEMSPQLCAKLHNQNALMAADLSSHITSRSRAASFLPMAVRFHFLRSTVMAWE